MPQGRSHERRKQLLASSLHNPACYAEALEIRRLLTGGGTLVTVGAVGYNGTSPLVISAGQSVTLTADVRQFAQAGVVNSNPTGIVSFFWDQSQGYPNVLIGNTSSSAIITPMLDTQYTGTFTLSPVPFLPQDNFGDYVIEAAYLGDSIIPAGNSFTSIQNNVDYPATQIDPNKGFVPVDFAQPATQTLHVTTQPSDEAIDATIDPPITVQVLSGTSVDTAADSITASITAGSSGTGTLLGTTTVSTVAGVATFSNLSVSAQGKYSLTFTDSNNLTVDSDAFQIGARLKVLIQPTTTAPGDAIEPSVTVAEVNGAGKPNTTATPTPITASLSSDSTGTGTLGGVLTATTVKGVAKFTNLHIDKPGQYTLNFSDSDGANAPSVSFTISTGRLMFVGTIARGTPVTALKPAVKVELVDKKGHLLTDVSSLITLNIIGNNSTDPISGNNISLVKGVALFTNLQFAQPGDYTLTATDDENDATATSKPFLISGVHLSIKIQPLEVNANAPLKYEVDLLDYKNRLVNDSTLGLGLTLTSLKLDSNGALTSIADTIDAGKAVNSGIAPAAVNAPGTYQLTFAPITENSDISYTIASITSKPFDVVAYHLAFVKTPSPVEHDFPLIYEVALEDFHNHIVSNVPRPDQLVFTLIPQTPSSTGTLISGTDQLTSGTAENISAKMNITAVGKYQLMVQDLPANPADDAALSVTSKVFQIGIGLFK